MKPLTRSYDMLLYGLAGVAAASLAAAGVLILADVALRNFGGRPIQASGALVEYILLFSTMAGAPWLVRLKGHITVSSFVGLMPAPLARACGIAVHLGSAGILLLLAWRAALIAQEKLASGAMDIRSVAIPAWCAYAILSLGFALMGAEFLRHLARGDTGPGAGGSH